MESKKTRLSKEDRQIQIIEAAMQLFIDKGYRGTTTLEIAEAAGISEVTLFRNFESKRDIFLLGVIPVLTETLEESLEAGIEESPREALERFLSERLALISKNHGIVRLILMENQVNQDFADINFIQNIGEIIKKGISRMGFSQKREDFIIRIIMGGILSFLFLPEHGEDAVIKFVSELVKMIEMMDENLEETNNEQ